MPAILAIGYLTGKLVDKEEILSEIGEEKVIVEKIWEILPGHNCGSCGYDNCKECAKAIADGEAEPNACDPGGEETGERIAELMEETDE